MKTRYALILILALLPCLSGQNAVAQQTDPGLLAAQNLLEQVTQPQRDGSHNAMLLGLRELEDPALLPLFRGLSDSPYLSMRIHGQLGAAALSPERRIDLTALAEIEDQRELVQVLSAAIDDDLIDNKGMATLLTWQGLDLPLRQAVALRLMGAGGKVDTQPFKESLAVELNGELNAAKLLQYALAALMLAESGDDAGKAALMKIASLQNESANAVLAQTLDAAMRHGFTAAGSLGLTVAKDTQRDSPLRLLGIQCAMRLSHADAPKAWQAMFKNEESSAPRIRLAMIALDSSEQVEPALFDTLAESGQWIGHIAEAGRAIASKDGNLAKAFEPLVATGQPLSVQWVLTYCQRSEPAQGADLLELIVRHYNAGPKHHRGRMTQLAIDAASALCVQHPKQATARLLPLLTPDPARDEDAQLTLRRIVLMGIARARSGELGELAEAITPDPFNDFTTASLRLWIRSKQGIALTSEEWDHASDIVQGVGQFDLVTRVNFAWAYLKHKGQDKAAIAKALR